MWALNRGNDRPWKLLNLKYLKRWNIRPERRSKIELLNPPGVMANGWKRDRKKRGNEGDGGKKKKKEKTAGNPRVTRTRPISEWINSQQKSRRPEGRGKGWRDVKKCSRHAGKVDGTGGEKRGHERGTREKDENDEIRCALSRLCLLIQCGHMLRNIAISMITIPALSLYPSSFLARA